MKKLSLLLLLMTIAISCSDDIQSNAPSIQGEVNGEFFRTNASSAYSNQDGSITLTGESGLDKITLKAAEFAVGTYELGMSSQSEAAYEINGVGVYSTGTTGDGAIEITRVTSTTLSGEFYFNAYLNGNGDTLNVNKGSFFDVPITNVSGGGNEGALTCNQAQQATTAAQTAYEGAELDSEGFEAICNNYKAALQNQIEACEDTDGTLQNAIDGLECGQ